MKYSESIMQPLQVDIKLVHPNAVLPTPSKIGDCGMDLTAVSCSTDKYYIEYDTGISIALPKNWVGLVFPRSSITNKGLILGNSVGVIDESFRGTIKLRFYPSEVHSERYSVGDRIGQLIIMEYPTVKWNVVQELCQTDRGEGGFGSTNKEPDTSKLIEFFKKPLDKTPKK